MEYTTVFEIRTIDDNPEFPLMIYPVVGLIILVLGAASLLPNRWRVPSKKQRRRSWFLILFGLSWLALTPAAFDSMNRSDKLHDQYVAGQFDIAEGVVRVVREEPKSGHAPNEVIEVGGMEFDYSFFEHTPAYSATISNGGRLKNGVQARIHYIDGDIVRVDIASELGD